MLAILSLLLALAELASAAGSPDLAAIDLLIEQLNYKHECRMPSYGQIKAAWTELKGIDRRSIQLNADQSLLAETVLDRWNLFEQQFDGAIASAKKRALLCRVEKYQIRKYNYSICVSATGIVQPNARLVRVRAPLIDQVGKSKTPLRDAARGPSEKSIEKFSQVSGISVQKLREMGYDEDRFRLLGNDAFMIMERLN